MPNYGSKKYWDDRYLEQINKTFDWLEDYNTLYPLITKYISPENRILMLGCGNSVLSEELYDNGYTNIVNVDISGVVIDQMKKRNLHRPNMEWVEMDALDMQYEECSFDIVFDKSTLDAILCGEMSFINTAIMLKEIQRVLKVGGTFISISYGPPESRILHFDREHLSFDMNCYILSK
jgi:ubiquinone/menaquinone biosynthesis C-methylase UbiE